jgi:UDP-glucose:glycoprotein glucosyltransferase
VRARQIPEWDTYDQEIARFTARLSAEEGVVTASVDDLAADQVVKAVLELEQDGVEVDAEVEITESHRIADEL